MAHNHHHHHAGDNIKVAFFLNFGFAILELIGGFWINSVAIMSDALHDLGDSLSLGLAWYFGRLSKRGSDKHFSFGYKRFSLLGAVVNSVVLLVGSFVILSAAIPRLWSPEPVNAPGMILFAILGVLVNGAAVLKLRHGTSMNERVVKLHLMEDVLGWFAVLAGGIILYFFDLPVIDPLLSIGITLFILYNVYRNLRQSMKIMLQGTPSEIDMDFVKSKLEQVQEVRSVHHLHIWTLDGTYNVLTLHAVIGNNILLEQTQSIKRQIKGAMSELNVQHVTVEFETTNQECSQADCL